MNVLFLIWNYWPCIEGGSERQARQVAAELASRGYTCTIWTALLDSELPRKESKDGTSIIRFGRWVPWQERARRILNRFHRFLQRNFRHWLPAIDKYYVQFQTHFDFWVLLPIVYITRWSFMREVRNKFKDIAVTPDIIHLHEPSWLGGFAVQLSKKRNVAVVCQEATNPVLPVLGYDVPDRMRIEHLRRDAHFIAMAPYLAEDLRAKGISNKQIHILPNGVKIPALKESRNESPIVLYVGNFSQGSHWKAFDVLFDAWKIIHEHQTGLRLVVLGGGDRSTWEKYVDRLGCASTVDFMGRVSNPEDYYNKAALFVLPSRVEGMSNALLEAQSWGLPCVVSDIPGNTAIVEDGVNGLVVAVNDHRALASAILKLNENPILRTQTGIAARERAKERYDIEKVMIQLLNIYHTICAEEN